MISDDFLVSETLIIIIINKNDTKVCKQCLNEQRIIKMSTKTNHFRIYTCI